MTRARMDIDVGSSCRCEGTGRGQLGATSHDGAMLPCTCIECHAIDPCRESGCGVGAIARMSEEFLTTPGMLDDHDPRDLDRLRKKP